MTAFLQFFFFSNIVLPFQKYNTTLFPLFLVLCSGHHPSSRFRLRADYRVLKKARSLQIAVFMGGLKVLVPQFLGFAKYHHLQCKLCFVVIIFKSSSVCIRFLGFPPHSFWSIPRLSKVGLLLFLYSSRPKDSKG